MGPEKRKAQPGDNESSKRQKTVGFVPMAKIIGAKWKDIDDESLEKYKKQAATEMERYRKEMALYREKRDGFSQSPEELHKSDAKETTERGVAGAG